MSAIDTIAEIADVRRRNNEAWMDLLRIAVTAAPAEAKAVLRTINANDRRISDLVAQLAEEAA